MITEESVLLTMTTGAIFVTSVIDAKENRQVAVVDLPRAFLHAKNGQDVIMFMRGKLAKLMTMIAQ